MHILAKKAQHTADAAIDENIWARLEAQQTTDEWKSQVDSMNTKITNKIRYETDPTANPNKKYTKIQEFNILDNYRLDDGTMCHACVQGRSCPKHGGQAFKRQAKIITKKGLIDDLDDLDDEEAPAKKELSGEKKAKGRGK